MRLQSLCESHTFDNFNRSQYQIVSDALAIAIFKNGKCEPQKRAKSGANRVLGTALRFCTLYLQISCVVPAVNIWSVPRKMPHVGNTQGSR